MPGNRLRPNRRRRTIVSPHPKPDRRQRVQESDTMETIIERRSALHRVRHMLYWSWRKYTAVLRVSVANNLAYIYEVLFRSVFLIMLIFVFGQLWKTTYSARGVSILGGFSMNAKIGRAHV